MRHVVVGRVGVEGLAIAVREALVDRLEARREGIVEHDEVACDRRREHHVDLHVVAHAEFACHQRLGIAPEIRIERVTKMPFSSGLVGGSRRA